MSRSAEDANQEEEKGEAQPLQQPKATAIRLESVHTSDDHPSHDHDIEAQQEQYIRQQSNRRSAIRQPAILPPSNQNNSKANDSKEQDQNQDQNVNNDSENKHESADKIRTPSIDDVNASHQIDQDKLDIQRRKKNQLNWLQRYFAPFLIKQDWSKPRRTKLRDFIDSNAIQTIMTLLTFYALYADDFRIAYADPTADFEFGIIAFVVFLIFLVELALQCYSIENYYLSFFFWLDTVAAISLIFDVEFMMKDTGLYGGGANEARAGRAARAGAKAGRIVRLVRLIRLTKLMKYFTKQQKHNQK